MVLGIVPRKNGFWHCQPVKMVIGASWCPRKSGLSSFYDCLLCLPLSYLLPFVSVET